MWKGMPCGFVAEARASAKALRQDGTQQDAVQWAGDLVGGQIREGASCHLMQVKSNQSSLWAPPKPVMTTF